MKENIYEDDYVEALFDEMSRSYSRMNYVTSFGFSERWRKQFVKKVNIPTGAVVADMLTGKGECWPYLLPLIGEKGHLIALDFSGEMLKHAQLKQKSYPNNQITILQENVFQNSIADASVDAIVSGFGLKTFNKEQLHRLAQSFRRILKDGGRISMVDVSVPSNPLLRFFYMFYLKFVIPILGRTFGASDCYALLGEYTQRFENAKSVVEIFKEEGFEVNYQSYFFGCASGFTAKKIGFSDKGSSNL